MDLKREIKHIIRSVSNIHTQSDNKPIFIFSTPRSGSTWLMEVLASQPGIKYYDEPFDIRREEVAKYGYPSNLKDLIPNNQDNDKILNYLEQLLNNQIRYMNPTPFRTNYKMFTNRVIFKIHEIEHMINKIKKHFNADIIFLLRHPIANRISRKVLPRINHFMASDYIKEKYLNDKQIELVENIEKSGDIYAQGILSWCFQNLIPLKFLDTRDWIIVSYEELVINPVKSFKMLSEKLDLKNLKLIYKKIAIPASNINLSNSETLDIFKENNDNVRRKKIIEKWKKQIDEDQEKKTFDILSVFEIDAYAENRLYAHDRYLNFDDTASK